MEVRQGMRSMGKDVLECLSDRYLHLVVLPTEACNFRCTYCYEDFRLRRMQPHVVEGIKRFLERRAPELDTLCLSWFGGEPLLARDILEDVMFHVQGILQERRDITLESDLTTNGWFLGRSAFERLLTLGVSRYQVAFDGPREWHDRTRRMADGRGTFDRIWKNLLAMRDVRADFKVTVRLHASRENHAALPEFIEEYARHFGEDARFRIFLRPLSPLGGPNDAIFPFFEKTAARRVVEVLARCAEEHRVDAVRMEHLQPICYAARGNSFVVRADGRINKCTVALEHPANQVGRIHVDGRVELEDRAVLAWMRGLWSGDEGELECPMRALADLPLDEVGPTGPPVERHRGAASPRSTPPARARRPTTEQASAEAG